MVVPANFAACFSLNFLTILNRNGGRWPAIQTFSASTAGTFCEELNEPQKPDLPEPAPAEIDGSEFDPPEADAAEAADSRRLSVSLGGSCDPRFGNRLAAFILALHNAHFRAG